MKVRVVIQGIGSALLDQETDRHWAYDVISFTRHWIHYGTMTFVFLTTLAAAAIGVFAR
jgi:hypothetical protein